MATLDPITGAVVELPFHQSFDAGLGTFTDAWYLDTSVPGQVTFVPPGPYLTSGMLETTGSPMSGHGYGTYTVHAMMVGGWQGPALMLWPGDNKWPGAEIDFGEIINDGSGQQYGALHWNDGGDHSDVRNYTGVQTGVFHDYQVVWEPGRLTYNVDGVQQLVYTDHVPADYPHGGMDMVFGFLNISTGSTLTVTDVDYLPLGTPAAVPAPAPAEIAAPVVAVSPVVSPVVSPAEVPAAATDWNALAAQAEANFAATGYWFVDPPTAIPVDHAAPVPAPVVVLAPVEVAPPAVVESHAEVPAAAVDWNALAAQAEANFAATGYWFI